MKIIEELLYSNEHEWVKVEGEKAFIGITDYAQDALGDIAYIEMPQVDDQLNAGDVFGVVESVKAASDLYIPVSGTVININEELEEDPAVINENPYTSWIIEVSLENKSELDDLMSGAEYKKMTNK